MKNLTRLADAIVELGHALRDLEPSAPEAPQPEPDNVAEEPAEGPTEEPEPEPVIALETVRAKLADLSRHGHTEAVRGLITGLGVSKLSEVDPTDYAKLLASAEELAA